MTTPQVDVQGNGLADQAAESAELAIKATQRVANDSLNRLSASVQGLREQAAPLLNRVGAQAGDLAQRGVDAVRDTSQELRDKALRASDGTLNFIRGEPVKAVLIAAATGAALMALIGLMARNRH
jgi:ElaB/YqjD/DUF883 family membrane-anchored ribosome-binding protein